MCSEVSFGNSVHRRSHHTAIAEIHAESPTLLVWAFNYFIIRPSRTALLKLLSGINNFSPIQIAALKRMNQSFSSCDIRCNGNVVNIAKS